jgi:dihydroneopterin aldolase
MAQVVRKSLWDAQVAQSGHYDKIIVNNLEVVVNAGKDVWGRQKSQRARISVTLTLGEQFTSASSTDSVDNSTVHYGTLSKAVQAQLQKDASTWMSTPDLSSSIFQAVQKVAGSAKIYAIETEVCYVKGSMFGDGISYITSVVNDSQLQSNVLHLRDVRIPCVIGVNSNERLQKQPVVVNLWIDGIPRTRVDSYAELETLLSDVSVSLNTKFEDVVTDRHSSSPNLPTKR